MTTKIMTDARRERRATHAALSSIALIGLAGCSPARDDLTGFSAGVQTTTTMMTTGSTTTTDAATTEATSERSPTTDTGNTPTTGAATVDTQTTNTSDGPCTPGEIVCDGAVARTCDGDGVLEEACPLVCTPGLGCTECTPGEGTCDGAVAKRCRPDGSGLDETYCDEVQDVVCDAEVGACVGACAPEVLGTSYIGCEYYPVITPNQVDQSFTFAVVVSNVTDEDADVTISRGGEPVVDIVVPKQSVEVVPLPWVVPLMVGYISREVPDGAYRLRSTRPVTVYQYNPLEYQKDGKFSFTNDASLLMPTNVWGKDTVVVARNTQGGLSGAYTVVAREDGTTVEITPSASGKLVLPGSSVAEDGVGVVMLDAGDVLQVLSAAGGGEPDGPDISDLTGTRVVSDKPVEVIGGHLCTYIPYDVLACDHLEEFNLPVDNLDREYLVSTPLVKASGADPEPKARMVRVVAVADATTLTYDPPQPGAPAMLAVAGDYAEFSTAKDFKITASAKIVVSEYFLGQEAGGDAGDPSMTIAVPIEQYRDNYSFHAPVNYESNFANVLAPTGAAISLDGQPLAGAAPIGGTGYSVLRVQLSNAGDGDHRITGDKNFGVQVYGYGQYTSYWYPAGLDLKLIPQ